MQLLSTVSDFYVSNIQIGYIVGAEGFVMDIQT